MAEAATPIAGEKPKRKQANRVLGPRPLYILIEKSDAFNVEDIVVRGATRKAEEALEATDRGDVKYLRVMAK